MNVQTISCLAVCETYGTLPMYLFYIM